MTPAHANPSSEPSAPRRPRRWVWWLVLGLVVLCGIGRWWVPYWVEFRRTAALEKRGLQVDWWHSVDYWVPDERYPGFRMLVRPELPGGIQCHHRDIPTEQLPGILRDAMRLSQLETLTLSDFDLRGVFSSLNADQMRITALICLDCRLDEETMRHIARWPRLTSLTISHCQLTPRQLRELNRHPRLVRLDLAHNPLSDECLTTFGTMPRLRTLDLTATGISDSAIIDFQTIHTHLSIADD